MSDENYLYCVCPDPACAQRGCRRTTGSGGSPFHGFYPPASEETTLRASLAEMTQLRDAWKAKYEQMKKAFNAADTLCFEVELALDGKPVPHDKDDLLDRVVALRAECEHLRRIQPPEHERHRGVGEGSWAVFAEKMLAERDAAREELAALRAQVAALLAASGVKHVG